MELVIFFCALPYIRYASRRGVQKPSAFPVAPRSTDMSLMYSKEKDEETGIRVLVFLSLKLTE